MAGFRHVSTRPKEVVIGVRRLFAKKSQQTQTAAFAATAEVHMSLVQMRTALNSLPMGVVILSSDGLSKWSNRAVYGLFAAGSQDSQQFLAVVDELLRDALHGRTTERTLEFGDPALRTLKLSSISLIDGGAAVLVEDITKQVMTDRVRTDFVANISHELRTPIGAVSLMAENLITEAEGTSVARMAGVILNEVTRLNSTIGDLLELARIEFDGLANRQPVEILQVIEEAVARLKSAALAKSVMISIQDFLDVRVMGDRAQLVSAVGNLIDNAVKFSEQGGIVTVSSTIDGGHVSISVADAGPGIATEHQARIFERFYRVDDARSRSTGGTGLGLAIVRHIALLHGGDVSVTSKVDEGSTFTLTIPIG